MSAGQRDPRAEVARLEAENAALRDLLAAAAGAAGAVPQSAGTGHRFAELRRATDMLTDIRLCADPGGSWGRQPAAAAAYLRGRAAAPAAYPVYAGQPAQGEAQGDAE